MPLPPDPQTLPNSVGVYYDNAAQMWPPVLLGLAAALPGCAVFIVPHGWTQDALLALALAAAFFAFILGVPFLFDLCRYWRYGPWARGRKPYIGFDMQGITLPGDVRIPWTATAYVHLEQRLVGGRSWMRVLEVGLNLGAGISPGGELQPRRRSAPGPADGCLSLDLGFVNSSSSFDYLTMKPDDIGQWAQAFRNAAFAQRPHAL